MLALERMPPWSRITATNSDPDSRVKILSELEVVNRQDTQDLRQAVNLYWTREVISKPSDELEAASRLFVLNRYVFNVPEWIPQGSKGYGVWKGVPVQDGNINLMWPLSLREGHIDLLGNYAGYWGPPYLGLDEFDDFTSRYGRRNLMKK